MVKTCSRCSYEKPLSEFYKNKAKKDGYYYCCKDCAKAKERARRDRANELRRVANDPKATERNRRNNLWRMYRITPEQYDAMAKDGCQICGKWKDLCVDHDHNCCPGKTSCGKCVRGILCRTCNWIEGWAAAHPDFMQRLDAYLNKEVC